MWNDTQRKNTVKHSSRSFRVKSAVIQSMKYICSVGIDEDGSQGIGTMEHPLIEASRWDHS